MALAGTNAIALGGGIRDTGVEATLQYFIPEIWGASIKDYMEKTLVLGNLATDMSAMVAGGGDRVHIPKHSELTTSALYGSAVETVIDTNIAFAKTSGAEGEYTLDVDQSFYSAVSITDLANKQSSYDVMNIYTQKLGYALAKRVDRYLHYKMLNAVGFNVDDGTGDGVASGNNVTFTAAGTYTISKAGITNAIQAVLEADGNLEDYVFLLPPATYSSLFSLDDFARYDVIGDAMAAPRVSGYVGKLAGINVVVSNNFTDKAGAATTTPMYNDANGTTDESDHLAGFLLHKQGLHIAYAAGMKSRVQSDYHLESLSTRFVADCVFGSAITSDNSVNKRVFALTDA